MDFDLRTLFSVVVGVALSLCVLTAALFVAMALTQDEDLTFELDRREASKRRRIGAYLYFVSVLVGIAAVIGGGVWRVLAWMPATWDEARMVFSGLAAMAAWPIMFALAGLPSIRRARAVNSAVMAWALGHFRYGETPSAAELKRFAADAEDGIKSNEEHAISVAKLEFAQALKARDEKFESLILQRLERAKAAEEAQREQQRAAEEAQLERKRRDEARRTAEQLRVERVGALLAKNVYPLPQIDTFAELPEDEEVSLRLEYAMPIWQSFKEHVVSARPKSIEDLPRARQLLEANVGKLPGVTARDGARLDLEFHGDERDGHCDAIGVEEGEKVPLFNALRFDDSLDGLLHAFFFGVGLMRKWSWGHGFYGRHYTLLVTAEELSDCFMADYLPLPAESDGQWPPTGIRLRRFAASSHDVSCLATGPNGDIFDMTIRVVRGSASAPRVRTVHTTGRSVLY